MVPASASRKHRQLTSRSTSSRASSRSISPSSATWSSILWIAASIPAATRPVTSDPEYHSGLLIPTPCGAPLSPSGGARETGPAGLQKLQNTGIRATARTQNRRFNGVPTRT